MTDAPCPICGSTASVTSVVCGLFDKHCDNCGSWLEPPPGGLEQKMAKAQKKRVAEITGHTIEKLRLRYEIEERELVTDQLERCGWSIGAAANSLGVYPNRLRRLIAKHGLTSEYAKKARGKGRPPVE